MKEKIRQMLASRDREMVELGLRLAFSMGRKWVYQNIRRVGAETEDSSWNTTVYASNNIYYEVEWWGGFYLTKADYNRYYKMFEHTLVKL